MTAPTETLPARNYAGPLDNFDRLDPIRMMKDFDASQSTTLHDKWSEGDVELWKTRYLAHVGNIASQSTFNDLSRMGPQAALSEDGVLVDKVNYWITEN